MRVTTPQGVKPFDRFVVREAIITRLLARLARDHNQPWFSPYALFAYVPLKSENVLVKSNLGSEQFVPWMKSERESFPEALRPPTSSESLLLIQAPVPKQLRAAVLMQEMNYQTFTDYAATGALSDWSLKAMQQLVAQIALAVISVQKSI